MSIKPYISRNIAQLCQNSFKIQQEGPPHHTANPACLPARLGFNITQLSNEVTNLEMTRSGTKVQAGIDITDKNRFYWLSPLEWLRL